MRISSRCRAGSLVAVCLLALQLSGACALGQGPAETRRQVAAHRRAVAQAAGVFLDGTQSDEARLAAIKPYRSVFEPRHVQAFERTARNEREGSPIRAAALERLSAHLNRNPALVEQILLWLGNPETPPELRRACLEHASSLSFSSLGMGPFRDRIMATMRGLTRDADATYREAAFSALCAAGDGASQKLLLEGLENPERALVPPERAVAILALDLHGDFYPTLNRIMLQPPNQATRVACIRVLGGYAPARETIVGYLQDPESAEDVRLAAVAALHANAPERLAGYALPVVADENAPSKVRAYAISAESRRRAGQNLHGIGPANADDFDALVRKLAQESRSADVREAAAAYLRRTGQDK